MNRCLVVTNDFPPRQGGIETFVYELTTRFPPDQVVVYTSTEPGAERFDAAQPFPIVRDPARMLLPVPRVVRRAAELARAYSRDRVWFGAAAPLGLMADRLRAAGARRAVATTHGHEVWWASVPGARKGQDTLIRALPLVRRAVPEAALPVVAGDSGGAPDAVRHGETGYVVDGSSVEEVAGRLVELLTTPDAAHAMGEKGRSWVRAEWSWDAAYQRLVRLLDG